jgi:chemotaxis protein CheD
VSHRESMNPEHREHQRRAAVIHPGGWRVESERPISTLLGSCVGVCLIDVDAHLAGMNHFLLPKVRRTRFARQEVHLSGDHAMEVLVNDMLKRGARKSRLIAKAFGGGSMGTLGHFAVGQMNIDFTTGWLTQAGIPLVASDFGGRCARQVIVIPTTGEVLCRRIEVLPAQRIAALLKREYEHAEALAAQQRKKSAAPDLF